MQLNEIISFSFWESYDTYKYAYFKDKIRVFLDPFFSVWSAY
jgi:hypothetical protein